MEISTESIGFCSICVGVIGFMATRFIDRLFSFETETRAAIKDIGEKLGTGCETKRKELKADILEELNRG